MFQNSFSVVAFQGQWWQPAYEAHVGGNARATATKRMASSGMLRRAAPVRTDILEELSSSIIRVTRIGELGT
jgi:hypothetical protein